MTSSAIAVVQTELSFVNQLVGLLTFGIYTPVTVRLVCGAQNGDDVDAGEDESEDGNQDQEAEKERGGAREGVEAVMG